MKQWQTQMFWIKQYAIPSRYQLEEIVFKGN